MNAPAVLGGDPMFPQRLPLVRPAVGDVTALTQRLGEIVSSGMLTNGPTVRELEVTVAERLQVPHVVAVSNCTAGLMLVYQALDIRGPVVIPSMTFSASAHAVHWAGGVPRWAEVDPLRCTLDPDDASRVLDGAAAISATHIYGAPAEVEQLQELADEHGIPLVYDAAHALGSRRRGVPIGGFGTAEVFSLSPTKVTVAGEGGLVTTRDPDLAAALRIGRDYGNPGNYDCQFPGLNARMSELHAAVALSSLEDLDVRIAWRNHLVEEFKKQLAGVPGVEFQLVDEADLSSYKDLTLILDSAEFGICAEQLQRALSAEGVDSRRYFHPPIHRQHAYARLEFARPLPVTEALSSSVLTPPLHSSMTVDDVKRLSDCITRIHDHAEPIRAALT